MDRAETESQDGFCFMMEMYSMFESLWVSLAHRGGNPGFRGSQKLLEEHLKQVGESGI